MKKKLLAIGLTIAMALGTAIPSYAGVNDGAVTGQVDTTIIDEFNDSCKDLGITDNEDDASEVDTEIYLSEIENVVNSLKKGTTENEAACKVGASATCPKRVKSNALQLKNYISSYGTSSDDGKYIYYLDEPNTTTFFTQIKLTSTNILEFSCLGTVGTSTYPGTLTYFKYNLDTCSIDTATAGYFQNSTYLATANCIIDMTTVTPDSSFSFFNFQTNSSVLNDNKATLYNLYNSSVKLQLLYAQRILYNEKNFAMSDIGFTSYDAPLNLSHKWNTTYTIDKKATYAAAGSKSIHCSLCNTKKSGSIVTISKLVPAKTSIKSLTAYKRAFTVKWTKKSYTGYQIRYSTSSKMSSPKTVTITSSATLSKKITSLKAKKKYYVQVRTYKTYNGKKYYSGWCTKKAITTK